jgi:hypothetical protein
VIDGAVEPDDVDTADDDGPPLPQADSPNAPRPYSTVRRDKPMAGLESGLSSGATNGGLPRILVVDAGDGAIQALRLGCRRQQRGLMGAAQAWRPGPISSGKVGSAFHSFSEPS